MGSLRVASINTLYRKLLSTTCRSVPAGAIVLFIRDGAFVAAGIPVGTAADVALVDTVGCEVVDAAEGKGVIETTVGPGVITTPVGLLVDELPEGLVVLNAPGPAGLAVLGLSAGLSVGLAAVVAFPVGLFVIESEGVVVGKMGVMTAGAKVEFAVGTAVTDSTVGFGVDGTGIAVKGLGATVGAFVVDVLVGTCVTAPAVA